MLVSAAVVAAVPGLLAAGLGPGLLAIGLVPGLLGIGLLLMGTTGLETVGAGLLASGVARSLGDDVLELDDASVLLPDSAAVFLLLVGDDVLPFGSVDLPVLLLQTGFSG